MEQQSRIVRPGISLRVTGKTIISILMLTVLAMTVLMLITLVYGVSIVGPAILDGTDNLGHYGIFVVLPVFVTIATLSGPSLFAYYLLIVAAILASASWVIAKSARTFFQETQGKAKSREHSPLFDTIGLLVASLFFTYATVLLVLLIQGNTGTAPSTGSLAESLFLLANAAVWEEIAVRVLLLGVPLLIIHFALRRTREGPHHYLLGGGFKFGLWETVLVATSAVIFGLAHWVGGWPAWKIPDATVAGLAFGYLFLKHGLPSAILMHFVNDYLTMPMDVFSSTTGSLGILTVLLALFWAIMGSVLFAYYVTRVVEFLTRTTLFEPKPLGPAVTGFDPIFPGPYQQPYTYGAAQQAPVAHAPGTGVVTPGPAVGHGYSAGYICPACGFTQARWADGKFHCLRCGKIS